jgi:ABC-2 type transport system ATP-binding protein
MSGNIIVVDDLNLIIKKDIILKDIYITFEKGKIHGIIGRNASGKTMLFKCICGFVRPTKGTVIIDQKQIGKDCDFPKNVGIIIETPGFIPYYSGYRNLKILAEINKKIGREEIKEVMRTVGLDPNLRRHVKKYSLGMRQRLGLAQAIMEKPDILVLDEPMNGLDKDDVKEMRDYLINLREEGKTILLASHSSEDISILCDMVCEMDKGVMETLE